MADTFKVLGQSNPSATTLTDIYTVPALTHTVVSTIMVANRDGTNPIKYRISVAVAGAADSNKQYIAYDVSLAANKVDKYTLGASLGPADVIRVYTDNATASFNVFGVEVS